MDQKYYTDINNLQDTINKYGVAIIPNILNDIECKKMESDMWDYLEHITQKWDIPINRLDSTSWNQIYNLNKKSLIFQFWNIGHCQMSWNLRQNEKIVDVFSKFWKVKPEDLLVSFDGASFELLSNSTNSTNSWFHTDDSYDSSEFKNLQSWVTAFDVEPGDATLVILESSNKYHDEFRKHFNINSAQEWFILDDEQLNFYKDKCEEKRICCPKGSLVLWDNRTVHYGINSTNKINKRCVSYLSYSPRSLCDNYNLQLKKYALRHLETTTHNPCNIILKSKNPYNNFITVINKPELTNLGKRLAGLD
jgi:hypothetical protein